jgi:hypothetical protein
MSGKGKVSSILFYDNTDYNIRTLAESHQKYIHVKYLP